MFDMQDYLEVIKNNNGQSVIVVHKDSKVIHTKVIWDNNTFSESLNNLKEKHKINDVIFKL